MVWYGTLGTLRYGMVRYGMVWVSLKVPSRGYPEIFGLSQAKMTGHHTLVVGSITFFTGCRYPKYLMSVDPYRGCYSEL